MEPTPATPERGREPGCLPEGSSLFDFHQKVSRVYRAQRACVRPVAASLGLGSGQPRILSCVAAKGTTNQREIADFFHIDPAGVSRMVVALRRGGFVSVTSQPDNLRANAIELTQAGHDAIQAWDACCADIEDVMLDGFAPEEREAFGAYLDRALANLTAELDRRDAREAAHE